MGRRELERLPVIRLFGALVRAEEMNDDDRMVYGVVTTEDPVQDYDFYDPIVLTFEATQAAAEAWRPWGNIREMHQANAVGVAREIDAREETRDLFIGAYIADDQAWEKVKSEVYKGFSINADPRTYEIDVNEDVIRVTDYEIIEVSLVDRPHDPGAVITLYRSVGAQSAGRQPQENEETVGGRRMLDEIWRSLMGEQPMPEDAETIVRAFRALNQVAAQAPAVEEATEAHADQKAEGDADTQTGALIQRLNGQVAELSGQVTALLTRVATLEAQPAPLPVVPTPPAEPTLEERIGELSRMVREKGLRPGSPEISQLMRLYQEARQIQPSS